MHFHTRLQLWKGIDELRESAHVKLVREALDYTLHQILLSDVVPAVDYLLHETRLHKVLHQPNPAAQITG